MCAYTCACAHLHINNAAPLSSYPAALHVQAAQPPGLQPRAAPTKQWAKKERDQNRVKRVYKTADEVLAAAPSKPLAQQPILDLRGPQPRLVTDLESLNKQVGWVTDLESLNKHVRWVIDLKVLNKLTGRMQHRMQAKCHVLLAPPPSQLFH